MPIRKTGLVIYLITISYHFIQYRRTLSIFYHEASGNDPPISRFRLAVSSDKALYCPGGVASAYKGLSNLSTHTVPTPKTRWSAFKFVNCQCPPPLFLLAEGILSKGHCDCTIRPHSYTVTAYSSFMIEQPRHEVFGMPTPARRNNETTYLIIPSTVRFTTQCS